MSGVWLSLGANLGDPRAALEAAIEEIKAIPGVRAFRRSSFYRTSPVDSSGPEYVNAAAALEWDGEALSLLHLLQKIELAHGRVRPAGVHNAPRTLDIDILSIENVRSGTPELLLPHPRMNERLFVLVPLAELEPDWTAPDGTGIQKLIDRVKKIDPEQQITKLSD